MSLIVKTTNPWGDTDGKHYAVSIAVYGDGIRIVDAPDVGADGSAFSQAFFVAKDKNALRDLHSRFLSMARSIESLLAEEERQANGIPVA